MVLDAPLSFLALWPPDVQAGVRAAAVMESREVGRLLTPEDVVLVMVQACLRLQAWSARDRSLPAISEYRPAPIRQIVPTVIAQKPWVRRPIECEPLTEAIPAVMLDGANTIPDIRTRLHDRGGHPVNLESLRATLSILAQRGVIVRLWPGIYARPAELSA